MDNFSVVTNSLKKAEPEILYIPVGEQDFAVSQGVMFKRKSFFDKDSSSYFASSPSLSENQLLLLSKQYGKASKDAWEKEEYIKQMWRKVLSTGNNFDCLLFAKENGIPKEEKSLENLFLKFKDRTNGDYPVSWEHVCEYIPEFEESYGYEKFLQLHRQYDIDGDVVESISRSNMKNSDKYFLYFVYEINE